jgi:hypothetical protein
MILIALAVVVLGTFGLLMTSAAAGSRGAAVVGALEALLFVAGTFFAALLSLLLFGMKCDESCDENLVPEARSGEWWHTLDAWQWNVQFILALAAFVATAVAFGLVIGTRYRAALITVGTALTLFCGWALIVAPLGDRFGI